MSLLLISLPLGATAPGWRWYNEPKVRRPLKHTVKPITRPQMVVTQSPAPMTATEQMRRFHVYMNEVKNRAVIDPTLNNVLTLMRINHFIDGKTTDFGMTWKQALLADPTLSYRLKHPTESLARQTQNAQIKAEKIQAIRRLAAQGNGLFFVYQGGDALSQKLAPSLQHFADNYHIPLLGISTDNQMILTIRENKTNRGKLNVKATPALLLVNPTTGSIKPLAYGFISQEELLGRFLNVATDFKPDF